MDRQRILKDRIRLLKWVFIIGLVLSGATAIPLVSEVDYVVKITGARSLADTPFSTSSPAWAIWLTKVQGQSFFAAH
jgi:hypothetical protein